MTKRYDIAHGDYTLITNVDFVRIGDVRCDAYAIVLAKSLEGFTSTIGYRMRGFLTEPSLPTFDYVIPSYDYRLVDAVSGHTFVLGEDGDMRALMRGALLEFPDFASGTVPPIQIITNVNSRHPLDVLVFENADITAVWDVLPRKVAEHWTAPNMPIARWVPAAQVRKALGV